MKRILVVDDEMQLRELLRRVLTAEGYEVVTAPMAAQALERIFRESFDLVILDLNLGDDSGMAILKKIRAAKAKMPVVIYSGAVTPDIEKEARAAGANEVLEKNVETAALTAQIKKIMKVGPPTAEGFALRKEKKILFVDDESGIRGMLTKFFKDKGFTTFQAADGESAINIVATEAVSVVLLDIEMPGMNGLTTLKKLLELKPGLGVVMATGELGDERVKEALAMGAYSYVLKPFDFMYLDLVVTSKLAIAGQSGAE